MVMRDERETNQASNDVNGFVGESEIDLGLPPPFKLTDIQAIAEFDLFGQGPMEVYELCCEGCYCHFWFGGSFSFSQQLACWPLYWVAQSTMIWALMVLGHDWYICIYIYICSKLYIHIGLCIFFLPI